MRIRYSATRHHQFIFAISASFAMLSLLIVGPASGQTYDLMDFYPLVEGSEYSYSLDPISLTIQGYLLTANATQTIKITGGSTLHGESTLRHTQALSMTGYTKPVGNFTQYGNQVDYMNWTDAGLHIHRRENTMSGSLSNESDSVTFDAAIVAFPRNISLGETVTVSDYSLDDQSVTPEYITLLEKTAINTDLGQFECLKIRISGYYGIETWYLARGVGCVMFEISAESQFGVAGDDLIVRLKQTNFTITNLPVDAITYPLTKQSTWLQEYYAFGAGWAWNWHPTLGWFYGDPADAGCWLYFVNNGWLYSTAEWFPFAFSATSARWTWVDIASGTVYAL
ncbi:MAG: hypothetical protein SFY80_10015 [Verrucomicrobiota bacterium]|nr:hypothetical protein [Verrucomicrobiota bacterium]